ncbi:MAG: flavodoxin [Deltaproteobacteria bacterium]|nr:flavodoxin [Deltaproteobacteria bacterium]
MSKVLIVYGSTTGNTESVAEKINDIFEEKDWDTVFKNVDETSVEELSWDYDLLLLGASTWGDEEIEIQEDFTEFYENMDSVSLSGKKAAVFGCGDSSYTHYCGAVDVIGEKLEKMGGVLPFESLKIDGDPDDVEDDVIDWATTIAESSR